MQQVCTKIYRNHPEKSDNTRRKFTVIALHDLLQRLLISRTQKSASAASQRMRKNRRRRFQNLLRNLRRTFATFDQLLGW
jgi:hypothetical protein